MGLNLVEIYREFEKEDLGTIKHLHTECGVMRILIERFPANDIIKQWAEYFIRVNSHLIENLVREVEYDRQTAREFEKL